MKKIGFLLVCFTVFACYTMGQNSTQNNVKEISEFYMGYQQYGGHYKDLNIGWKLLFGTQSKWSFGGGIEFKLPLGLVKDKTADSILPVKGFNVNTAWAGFYVSAAYRLPIGFAILDGCFGFNGIEFRAYDERCEIDDGDGSTTSMYHINRSDRKNWGSDAALSIRASYLLPIKSVGLRLMVGYDILPRVNRALIENETEINSHDWEDFQTYYGNPNVNLYEASEEVRRLCSMGQLYFGISIGYCCIK